MGIAKQSPFTSKLETTLIVLCILAVMAYSLELSLSPAVLKRSWSAEYRWDHWVGFFLWLGCIVTLLSESRRKLPEHDPFILPVVGLLSGWGMLTIWRLLPAFGLRQAIWLCLACGIFILGLSLPSNLVFLRRYKYLWVTASLILTGLTLVFGTNPSGYGARMWLGCCGVYLQPSEPLKLMLIVYLSAYLADLYPLLRLRYQEPNALPTSTRNRIPWLSLLAPTLIMTLLGLGLLIIQRDLGTAILLLLLYMGMLYLAGGESRVMFISTALLLAAGASGYFLYDVVQLRVDTWFNPWEDPSGKAYQIIQGLMAIANGGIFGRGAGMGSPWLVPVVHSDMIFSAIAEESGLAGGVVLLLLFSLLVVRGLSIAIRAADVFRRLLAGGLAFYLGGQALLIMGGNLRLFPLTGVTLPFVSYGGSSLMVCMMAVLLLMHISHSAGSYALPESGMQRYTRLGRVLLLGFVMCILAAGWWGVARTDSLLSRTDNPRRSLADLRVRRGSLLDRKNRLISATLGTPGEYRRYIFYPPLSNVVGYTHPIYGQTGLEASLDGYLRGVEGYPAESIWWHHLLYGEPLPGLNVRLSLDLDMQRQADQALQNEVGAVVLMNADSGEVLAMSSHPTFDANYLSEQWEGLIRQKEAPLLNRALSGRYPAMELIARLSLEDEPFLLPQLPWLASSSLAEGVSSFPIDMASPLQVGLLASALNHGGELAPTRLALAVHTPQAGWVVLPPLLERLRLYDAEVATTIIRRWELNQEIWGFSLSERRENDVVSWFVGGTMPTKSSRNWVVVVLLESSDLARVQEIAMQLLQFPLPEEVVSVATGDWFAGE